jgi:hypothetical protein
MKKLCLLLSLGVLFGSLAFAQDDTNPNDRAAGANAFQGCLSGSTGNYILIQGDFGTALKLVGDDSRLGKHVGQEVSVTGKLMDETTGATTASDGSPSQAAPAAGSSNHSEGNALKVKGIETLSKHCKSSDNTPPAQ